jgi:hypothetical protein
MADTDQVVVTLDDGTDHTVRRNEVTETPKTGAEARLTAEEVPREWWIGFVWGLVTIMLLG